MITRRFGFLGAISALLAAAGCSMSTEEPQTELGSDEQQLGENIASCTSGSGWTSPNLMVDASASTSHTVILSPGSGVVKVNGRTCKDNTGTDISITKIKQITLKGTAGTADTFVLDFSLGLPSGGLLTTNGIIVNGQEATSTTTPDTVVFKGSDGADPVTVGQSATYASDQTIAVALSSTNKVTNVSLQKLGDPVLVNAHTPVLIFTLSKGADTFSAMGGFASTAALSFGISAYGGEGNDSITGGNGADKLYGGPGNDTFISAALDGADTIDGGGDSGDTMDYSGRTSGHPVLVDLNSTVGRVWGGNLRGVNMGTHTVDIDPGTGTAATVTFSNEATPIAIRDAINATTNLAGVASLVGPRLVLTSTGVNNNVIVDTTADATAGTLLGLASGTFVKANDGEAGEGDDIQNVANVNGGAGADVIIGSSKSNTLDGKGGDDILNGGPVNIDCTKDVDSLKGDLGNDWFDMATDADCNQTVVGGGGVDVVDYSQRTAFVNVTLDGSTASGKTNEADKVGADVEVVLGSAYNDNITGSVNVDYLFGGQGVDTILAGVGNDHVWGGPGADKLNGESGDDTFYELTAYQASNASNEPLAGVASGKWAGLGLDVYGADQPGVGDDVINGGVGSDKIDLSDTAAAISVSLCLDSAATSVTNSTGCGTGNSYGADDDDGLGTTANNYVNVEWLAGGSAGNIFIGTSADEIFEGGAGVDVILGQGGNDTIYGFKDSGTDASSADVLCGGDGDDTITGGGAATIEGEGQMRTTGSTTMVLASHNGMADAQDPSACYGGGTTYAIDSSGVNLCFAGASYQTCVNN